MDRSKRSINRLTTDRLTDWLHYVHHWIEMVVDTWHSGAHLVALGEKGSIVIHTPAGQHARDGASIPSLQQLKSTSWILKSTRVQIDCITLKGWMMGDNVLFKYENRLGVDGTLLLTRSTHTDSEYRSFFFALLKVFCAAKSRTDGGGGSTVSWKLFL